MRTEKGFVLEVMIALAVFAIAVAAAVMSPGFVRVEQSAGRSRLLAGWTQRTII